MYFQHQTILEQAGRFYATGAGLELLSAYFARHALLANGLRNAKAKKDQGAAVRLLSLLSFRYSGIANLCQFANGCENECLVTSGHGAFLSTLEARLKRTVFLLRRPKEARECLRRELGKTGVKFVRLNVFSDLWFGALIREFSHLQFWDYTRNPRRYARFLGGLDFPRNYHLTYSLGVPSPQSEQLALDFLGRGGHVAVVFRDSLPETWRGYPVWNGEHSDLRFLDPQGAQVIGLLHKQAHPALLQLTKKGVL